MTTEKTTSTSDHIILTTGVYDLIKDHVRKKRANRQEEEILTQQLRKAQQVTRANLPADVVTVDTRVTIIDRDSKATETYMFVPPAKAKKKNNTESILTSMGLALVGCKTGDTISWDFDTGTRKIEILNVERLS